MVPAPVKSGLLRLNRGVAWVEDTLLVVILAAMMLLAGSQIFMRNFMDSGFALTDPLLRIGVLWLGLLGALAATRDRHQITVDIFAKILKGTGRKLARFITDLFAAAVCGLLSWHSGRFVLMEYEDGVEIFPGLESWMAEAIIPVGFGIIALRYLGSGLLAFDVEQPEETTPP